MNVFFNNFKIKRVESHLLSWMFAAAFYLNNRGEREESYVNIKEIKVFMI